MDKKIKINILMCVGLISKSYVMLYSSYANWYSMNVIFILGILTDIACNVSTNFTIGIYAQRRTNTQRKLKNHCITCAVDRPYVRCIFSAFNQRCGCMIYFQYACVRMYTRKYNISQIYIH